MAIRTRSGVHVDWRTRMKALKDVVNLDELAKVFDLPTSEDLNENWEYAADAGHYAYEQALKDEYTEREAEAAREKAEQAAQDEQYHTWHNAVTGAIEDLFGAHGLSLEPRGRDQRWAFEYRIVPEKSWEDAAEKIMTTINGVGQFEFRDLEEFLESGPYTARQAVLTHWQWIKDYPAVYGDYSAQRRYERAVR
jgi:hypothetical protein